MSNHQLNQLKRRTLLKSAAAVAGGAVLPGWFAERLAAQDAAKPVKSPNERPRILLVGCGGQGRHDTKLAQAFGDVVAVCDVDRGRAEFAAGEFKAEAKYSDFRKAIAHKGVDVVINATPDHWHTLVNMHAMRQGKDVYSEKPLTLTIDEGRRLIEVVKQTKRILQTGSQQRSDGRFRLACELVRNGRLGKLKTITTRLPTGLRGGPFKATEPPETLDWDFW